MKSKIMSIAGVARLLKHRLLPLSLVIAATPSQGGFLEQLEAGAAHDHAAAKRFDREVREALIRGKAAARRERAEREELRHKMESPRSGLNPAPQSISPYSPAIISTGSGSSSGAGSSGIHQHSDKRYNRCELHQNYGGKKFSVVYDCDDESTLRRAR